MAAPQIDPSLLEAIVNGDMNLFLTILTSCDLNGVLSGVTCGENSALHVVAGVIEKSSPISQFHELLLIRREVGLPWAYHTVQVPHTISRTIIGLFKSLVHKITKLFKAPQRDVHFHNFSNWHTQWSVDLKMAHTIYHEDKTLLYTSNCAGETPLHCAAKAGKLCMVSLLVNLASMESPDKLQQLVWARNKGGETALHEAARFGYSDIVKVLLSADDNVACLEDNNGISPLYWAVTAGCLDVVRMLMAPNRLTSYSGPDGQTALHAAVVRQKETITRAILARNPPLADTIDIAGNTPLHYAALIGNTFAVRELLLKNTRPVYRNNLSGSFPVHLAAEEGNVKVIKELQSRCPDVGELLDKEERNFLHIAVQKKRTEVITLICQEGMNAGVMNAKDKDGNTPLHLAVISSESEIFGLLFKTKTVNLNIRNKAGLTPLDISASLQDRQLKYSLIHQNVIYRALLYRRAFQNPCQPDLSKKVGNLVKARPDFPNRTEGKEMCNDVEDDIEKELTDCENKSKSLTTGAVLIASATFIAIFTVSGNYVYTSGTRVSKSVLIAFVLANMLAFICATMSTIWLLYAALSNFQPKYRKIYFRMCTPLLYVALHLFILAFGLGSYIAIAPLSYWLATVILTISFVSLMLTIFINPRIIFPQIIQHQLAKLQ